MVNLDETYKRKIEELCEGELGELKKLEGYVFKEKFNKVKKRICKIAIDEHNRERKVLMSRKLREFKPPSLSYDAVSLILSMLVNIVSSKVFGLIFDDNPLVGALVSFSVYSMMEKSCNFIKKSRYGLPETSKLDYLDEYVDNKLIGEFKERNLVRSLKNLLDYDNPSEKTIKEHLEGLENPYTCKYERFSDVKLYRELSYKYGVDNSISKGCGAFIGQLISNLYKSNSITTNFVTSITALMFSLSVNSVKKPLYVSGRKGITLFNLHYHQDTPIIGDLEVSPTLSLISGNTQ